MQNDENESVLGRYEVARRSIEIPIHLDAFYLARSNAYFCIISIRDLTTWLNEGERERKLAMTSLGALMECAYSTNMMNSVRDR